MWAALLSIHWRRFTVITTQYLRSFEVTVDHICRLEWKTYRETKPFFKSQGVTVLIRILKRQKWKKYTLVPVKNTYVKKGENLWSNLPNNYWMRRHNYNTMLGWRVDCCCSAAFLPSNESVNTSLDGIIIFGDTSDFVCFFVGCHSSEQAVSDLSQHFEKKIQGKAVSKIFRCLFVRVQWLSK